ncbi:MAG: hypothetical protein GY714_12215 [Desulfobacterales bacterium]|nr:hypothetical protein [Desulfobacterales bacterium]
MPDWALIKTFLDLFTKYDLYQVILVLIVWYLVKKILNKHKRFKKDLPGKIAVDLKVNNALESLIVSTQCSRASLYQYHNGDVNTEGVHMGKCSNTHERVQVGVKSIIGGLQNMPNSLYAGWNSTLLKEKEICCADANELKEKDISMYSTIHSQGVESFYVVGLFSIDMLPIGFVRIDYCYKPRKLSEYELQIFRATSLKICGLIMSRRVKA